MDRIVIVIPAFEPGDGLVGLVRRLLPDFGGVVVVDDGSRASREPFRELGAARVLVHPENRGKGAALKTAFAEVLGAFPDAAGVVTVDADGQHCAEDVVRVARAMTDAPSSLVLGVRTFGAGVPLRSRIGNLWTSLAFRLLTGRSVSDTQSGLRGIPLGMLPRLLRIPGERYEYEIRMLVDCAVRGEVVQVPISTVYLDGNRASHFRPLADSLLTQRALFSAARRRENLV
ncbi:MAG: glycosyltransferase family 2 protein [Kiritimatiellae bacterium]|nr:glycosyltransferase family 2 protein [Kiritimatiellia bacterium]